MYHSSVVTAILLYYGNQLLHWNSITLYCINGILLQYQNFVTLWNSIKLHNIPKNPLCTEFHYITDFYYYMLHYRIPLCYIMLPEFCYNIEFHKLTLLEFHYIAWILSHYQNFIML